jgi:hypothetical protein
MCLLSPVLNALIDALELGLQFGVESGESFFDRRQQNRCANLAQNRVLVTPTLVQSVGLGESWKVVRTAS